ncbi:UdgX family uracil-DNA binding protein [Rhodococcus sp. SGAir0479]|uniref:UdgX family uracil-DNA binding protein n=1 Tax=Rhodococcus sp. SGAir0479 TaxID=2567884 RepID=UPI0010CD1176|nr:UdgX family uracil-DNA binding protein [Rhodococcus sp. SGAir0479]QCQ91142.1 uracil-DNA glycosylase [Rhodococcus sp. SGAir0479]
MSEKTERRSEPPAARAHRRESDGAAPFVPESAGLGQLAEAARSCRGCGLFRPATQTVFGAGPATAELMLVGEQPGDAEDLAGSPFVGPAGKLLMRALADAHIDRRRIYLTNAVKHFKFTRAERGKRRIHQKPSRGEVVACRPWLVAEIRAVQPRVLLCLGATAAQSLLGPSFRVTAHRGEELRIDDYSVSAAGQHPVVYATVHPSSILRGSPEDRDDAYAAFVADLRTAAAA